MFKNKDSQPDKDIPVIDTATFQRAEDGTEMLFALARFFEYKGDKSYTEQIRNAAHAMREIIQKASGEEIGEADSLFGANEHASKIRVLFDL